MKECIQVRVHWVENHVWIFVRKCYRSN